VNSSSHELILSGCAPIPLAHYLKALGVLRLVAESEHGDATTTARWVGDQFVFASCFDREALVSFFLRDYCPTAVLAPWNGGSGFFPKDSAEAISAIGSGAAVRLGAYRKTIAAARREVERLGLRAKPDGEAKAHLLHQCRNQLPDDALGWLDAVFVLGQDGPKFPPLLGTGGNDGRLEFTNNFMQRITEVMDATAGEPAPESERWLRAALFGEAAPGLATKSPIGQFFPGAAGGANATSGFDAPSAVNPWDFIMMIEGALLFAAASVKKLESAGDGALVYPFCVRQAGVGYASAAGADEAEARCEMWLPLWERATSLPELRAVFSEGRAQVRGRPARNGVDFAQAAVTLGVDRGIGAFQRYGFQVRNGLAYFATPLERVLVRRNTRADLLADVEHWHDRLRQKASASARSNAPASVTRALSQLERRILELCRDGGRSTLLAVLASIGAAERALAKSLKWTQENYLHPLGGLGPGWLAEADDGSAEFRLAAALAGARASLGEESLWLRQHLEPLTIGSSQERSWVNWAEQPGNDVVWHEGDLVSVFHAILARRLVRFEKAGVGGWPDWSPRYAPLDDITAFIEGRVNEELLADLLWGIACVDPVGVPASSGMTPAHTSPAPAEAGTPNAEARGLTPSAFYALLKLCHHPARRGNEPVPLDPRILHRAMNGDGEAACALAVRRLRASGLHPLVKSIPVRGDVARRTAAAVLFPISPRDYFSLTQTIINNKDNT
jgi:CRISPR-associated protein Csx17